MTGVGPLLRFALRRDRWLLLWWSVGITFLYYSQAVGVETTYATQAELDRAAAALEQNPAMVGLAGPARALDTVGGQVAWQSAAFGAVAIALMVMFVLGRHTRAEEESGRDELLRAAPVDRTAPMLAAVLEALLASVLVGALVALSLVTYPLAAADSVALGLGLTLVGWFFTGGALVAMQLTTGARAAYGLVGVAVGLAYVLRAVGDVTGNGLSWASPIGWFQAMQPFSGLRWWPAVLLLLASVPAFALALRLFVRRDHGSGLWPDPPGPAYAGRGLLRPLGAAWRTQRGPVLGWSLGLFLTGLCYGSIGDSAGALVGDSQAARDIFIGSADDLVAGFFGAALQMLALISAGFAISSALRPLLEEEQGYAETVLTTALSRRAWLRAQVVVTVLGTVAVTGSAGLGTGLGYAMITGDASRVLPWTGAMLAWALPVLVLAALARLLVGLAPRAAVLAWTGLVFCVAVMLFGDVLSLPGWLQDVSPFEHLALVPAESFRVLPAAVVAAVAAAVSLAGQAAFLRRDVR